MNDSVLNEKDQLNKSDTKSKNNHFDDKRILLEDLAPDGGWGYVIALAMIIVFVTSWSAGPCFPIVFGEFFESSGQSGSAMTTLNSIFMVSFSISGVFTNVLLKKFPVRLVGVGAAIIFSIPWILCALATHVYQIGIVFFIQGIGSGLMTTICSANFNAYFVKKRTKVMSIVQVLIATGGIAYPMMIENMMINYGFRGTIALLGALSLNCIVGMMMMHPVEWHLRDIDEVLQEKRLNTSKLIQDTKTNLNDFLNMTIHSNDRRYTIHLCESDSNNNRWSSLGNLKNESGHIEPLLIETLKGKISNFNEEYDIRPRSKSHSNKKPFTQSLSTLSGSSFGNVVALAEAQQALSVKDKIIKSQKITEDNKVINEEKSLITSKPLDQNNFESDSSILKTLTNMFELSLLKDQKFLIMTLGISFVFISDFTFTSLFPLAMLHSGFTNKQTALTITVVAVAELVSRILFAIFTYFTNVRPKIIFFWGMVFMGFVKLGYLYLETTLTGILLSMVLIGMVRSFIYVPQPLVVVENYPVEMYVSCCGIFSLVSGFIMVVLGPLVGLIKDLTDNFAIAQLILIAINCCFIIPWAIELIYDYRTKRKDQLSKNLSII